MKKSKFLNTILSVSLFLFSFSCSDNVLQKNLNIEENNNSIEYFSKSEKKYNVSFIVKDKNVVLDLIAEGIDLHGSGKNGKFSAYVNDKQLELLKNKKISIIQKVFTNDFTKGLPQGYHTVQQVLDKIREYSNKYPEIAKLQDIGDSWEKTQGKANNDIWALTVTGNKNNVKKPSIVFMSGIHARELAPVELNLRLMDLLLSNYGKDTEITNYLDTTEVIFIPLANIDGRLAVERGENMWRKNRHIDAKNKGVDLNRNFDDHWNFEGLPPNPTFERMKRQLQDPYSEIYSGEAPFSEPETKSYRDFLDNKKVNVFVDLHAYGEMIIYPPGYTNSPIPATPIFKKVASYLSSKNGYRTGTSIDLLYPTCGTTKDWAHSRHGAISFTIEVGDDSDGFRPNYSRIDNIWNKNKEGFLYLIKIASNPNRI
jgi:succinylglutamate desuccinylase